jgi:hypothetical protein
MVVVIYLAINKGKVITLAIMLIVTYWMLITWFSQPLYPFLITGSDYMAVLRWYASCSIM